MARIHAKALPTEPWPKIDYRAQLYRRGARFTCRILYMTQPTSSRGFVDSIRAHLFSVVRRFLGNGERSGLFLSMALGARDGISRRTEEAYKKTGLAHVLVVSGYQVTLLFLALAALLRAALLPLVRRGKGYSLYCIGLGLIAVLCAGYVALTGWDNAGIRAQLAAGVLILSLWMDRETSLFQSSLVAFFFLLLFSPGVFLDPGVQLTYAALFGIALGIQNSNDGAFKTYSAISWYAFLTTSLVVICWFDSFPAGSFVCNLIFAPLLSIVSCKLGFIALLAATVGIDPFGWGLRGVSLLLVWMNEAVVFLSGVPGIHFNIVGQAAKAGLVGAIGLMVLNASIDPAVRFFVRRGAWPP